MTPQTLEKFRESGNVSIQMKKCYCTDVFEGEIIK